MTDTLLSNYLFTKMILELTSFNNLGVKHTDQGLYSKKIKTINNFVIYI